MRPKTKTRLHHTQILVFTGMCALQWSAPALGLCQTPQTPAAAPVPAAPPKAPASAKTVVATAPVGVAPPASAMDAPQAPQTPSTPQVPPVAAPQAPAMTAPPAADAAAAPTPGMPATPGEVTQPPSQPGQPPMPDAAQPTAPPAYVEPAPSIQVSAPPELVAPPTAAPNIDETLSTTPKSKLPSYIMWGVGGASLIAGGVLGALALGAKSDFDDKPTYEGADRVESRAIAADVAFGLSAVLLITGTAFYFMPGSTEARPTASTAPERASARLHVTPLLGRTNGGALSLEF